MKNARGWILLGAIALLIGGAAYLLQPHVADSPEHSSDSDAPNGASAALLFAQAMGHPTDQLTRGFELQQPATTTIFVFTPTSQFTPEEADRTREWVSNGATLVYASEQGDPELDRTFGIRRFSAEDFGAPYYGLPVMAGVATVDGAAAVTPLDPSPDQVTFLRTASGGSAGFFERVGFGTVYVLADPLVLCNGYLDKGDNGRLLADLMSSASPGSTVAFDEYHHGLTVGDFTPQSWLLTPWGAGLLWFIVAMFFAFFLRGRRFGPLVPRPPELVRSDAEWSVAVGELLRRSRARNVTLGLLATATERAVAARTGLPLQPRERFWNALWVRAPEVARELAAVENTLHSASASERDVLNAARRLHRIAHPVPGQSL
ncbi:MAG TPA: DUF4350 domain-containing protein [Candidatus Dormibacteraeota bacterium]|nr:DUF4350 domain-containing protein [Candidatus Dormibacteraeota bacterium]